MCLLEKCENVIQTEETACAGHRHRKHGLFKFQSCDLRTEGNRKGKGGLGPDPKGI